MIVPTMTIEEVRHEMLCDYEAVHRKSFANTKIMQQEMLRKGLHHQTQTLKYKSARNNNWTILSHIELHRVLHNYYIETTDNRGKVAYKFMFDENQKPEEVVKYNTHFFQRYRERQQPNLANPADIIRYFFKHNVQCDIGETEPIEGGLSLVNYIMAEGVGLGWSDHEKKIVKLKTFLPHHMLNKSQQSLAEYIKKMDDSEEFIQQIDPESLKDKFK